MSTYNRAVYNGEQLTRFQNVSTQGEIIAGDTGDKAVIAQLNAKYALVVRKIVINVNTSAAQAFNFKADGAGGDEIFNVAATPGVGPKSIDFGPLGYELPAGEGLEIGLGGTGGNAFIYFVEAYKVPVATMTPAQITG